MKRNLKYEIFESDHLEIYFGFYVDDKMSNDTILIMCFDGMDQIEIFFDVTELELDYDMQPYDDLLDDSDNKFIIGTEILDVDVLKEVLRGRRDETRSLESIIGYLEKCGFVRHK